ncbi:EmrB/QacA subfamily drug resistance transporter [Thermocatellispora tengchongensis]|uniref:EmrB/QacA subfamily drug resistance transporter n=1 Tax=Thermocatellispora tengchongensis TaxID=1073253 RepID=A0A840PAT8_9ACTN|nr:MFS transporter [Thermocatellispora tengchongensis]MBB5136758.1 EmrB/QacA subfamily drug resistance transporter [Thermocatellispora tengchongensis]
MTTSSAARRSWWVMGILGLAQLMVTLDNSIVNIALPAAQADLRFDDAQRPWVVTAYALAFGCLLLLGGRICDLFGGRRVFLIGLTGFATASVLGGLAPDFAMLVTARALQGTFGALLAPAALSLLTTAFPTGRERVRAFGVFATLAVSGGSIGMLLGGSLTQYADWRWTMFVNVLIAAAAFAGGVAVLPNPPSGERQRLDIPGAATAAAGLFLVVYGFAVAESDGWTAPAAGGSLTGGVVLLIVFVLIQRRAASPLLPLRLVLDRYRGGALLACFVSLIGMFGVILFLTYLLQRQLGFSPMATGLGFLPMTAGIMTGANVAPAVLLPRMGPRAPIAAGLLLSAGSLLWLSSLTVDSAYVIDVLGPLILLGVGLGTAISTSINTATAGVGPADAGIASAAVNAVQQIGGSIGLALLSTIAGTTAAARPGLPAGAAEVYGYTVAFAVAAAIFLGTAILVFALIPARRAFAGTAPARASAADLGRMSGRTGIARQAGEISST